MSVDSQQRKRITYRRVTSRWVDDAQMRGWIVEADENVTDWVNALTSENEHLKKEVGRWDEWAFGKALGE